MLVEFCVKNFRSLRDQQIFSLVASKDTSLKDSHTLATGLKSIPAVLRSAVIYGANASGKSNLIKALQYMRNVVIDSAAAIQPGQHFNIQPFLLDNECIQQPIEFEMSFLLNSIRHQYGFTLNTERILSEYLLVYKTVKPQRWFEREYDVATNKYTYHFSSSLKGARNIWENATRPNALFLSTAVQLNSEILQPVFDWFANQLIIVNEDNPFNLLFSMQQLKQPEIHKKICNFLNAADISIADIELNAKKVLHQRVNFDLAAGKMESQQLQEIEQQEVFFHHSTDKGKAIFSLKNESHGTRIMFFLAGPFLHVLKKGVTLVIDELDTSLHTLLVKELIRLFHSANSNPNAAQLIFTTHDTALLNAYGLFRRDQIWLVEKDHNQASTLIGLAEFSPRKNEALEQGYLQGRYGGVPFIDKWEL